MARGYLPQNRTEIITDWPMYQGSVAYGALRAENI